MTLFKMDHETKQSSQRGKHEWLRNISIMFNNSASKHHRLTNKRHNVGNGSVFRRKMTGEEWRLDARFGDTN